MEVIFLKITKNLSTRLFVAVELILIAYIPFIVWWGVTPTNVLNSDFFYGVLNFVGLSGITLLLLVGIPLGIVGIIRAKKCGKKQILVKVLSIILLAAGIILNVVPIIILFMTLFGLISV